MTLLLAPVEGWVPFLPSGFPSALSKISITIILVIPSLKSSLLKRSNIAAMESKLVLVIDLGVIKLYSKCQPSSSLNG